MSDSDIIPPVDCPAWAAILGALGVTAAVTLTGTACWWLANVALGMGAAYGTAKSAMGIAVMGVMHPELIVRSLLPVIMSGILALYGVVVGMMINALCIGCIRRSNAHWL